MINVLLVEDRKMSRDSMIGYMKGADRYEPHRSHSDGCMYCQQ